MLKAFLELREIHRVFEAVDQALTRDIGVQTCIEKCGKCCRQNTPVWSTIDAMLAVSILTGIGKFNQAMEMAEGWLLEKDNCSTYEGMPLGLVNHKIHAEWLNLTLSQCPFLSDYRCFIHEARPLGCRAYGVTRDVMGICPRPLGLNETIGKQRYAHAPFLRNRVLDFREDCKVRNPAWARSGFVPTLLFRAGRPEIFKAYVLDNKIASAKIIAVDYETSLLWQPQLDELRKGTDPDLVAAMGNKRILVHS